LVHVLLRQQLERFELGAFIIGPAIGGQVPIGQHAVVGSREQLIFLGRFEQLNGFRQFATLRQQGCERLAPWRGRGFRANPIAQIAF